MLTYANGNLILSGKVPSGHNDFVLARVIGKSSNERHQSSLEDADTDSDPSESVDDNIKHRILRNWDRGNAPTRG